MPHLSNDGSRFTCIKKCQYKGRIWEPGDLLIGASNDVVPNHFRPLTRDEQTPTKRKQNTIDIIGGWNSLGSKHFEEFLRAQKEDWKTASPQARLAAMKKWISVAPGKKRDNFPIALSDNDEIDFEELKSPKVRQEKAEEIDDEPPPDPVKLADKGKKKE